MFVRSPHRPPHDHNSPSLHQSPQPRNEAKGDPSVSTHRPPPPTKNGVPQTRQQTERQHDPRLAPPLAPPPRRANAEARRTAPDRLDRFRCPLCSEIPRSIGYQCPHVPCFAHATPRRRRRQKPKPREHAEQPIRAGGGPYLHPLHPHLHTDVRDRPRLSARTRVGDRPAAADARHAIERTPPEGGRTDSRHPSNSTRQEPAIRGVPDETPQPTVVENRPTIPHARIRAHASDPTTTPDPPPDPTGEPATKRNRGVSAAPRHPSKLMPTLLHLEANQSELLSREARRRPVP